MSKMVGYIRVSTKDQNLDRQREQMKKLGIEDKYIYEDKKSGKDFDRIGYQYMKRCLEKGDTLVIEELDRLGRNDDLRKEWAYFVDNQINVRVLTLPSLNLNYDDEGIKPIATLIRNIVFELFCWEAQNKRETILRTQAEGIKCALAEGRPYGRPKTILPDNFEEVCTKWKNGEITGTKAIELTGMKRTNFYKQVKLLKIR